MNNLMTKSFLDYVDLRKQALGDTRSEPKHDIESGFNNAEQESLSLFYAEVEPIQSEITSISDLLSELARLNSESKSTRTRNLLRGIRDQMDSDVTSILQKAQLIKSSLSALDASNASNRVKFGQNSPVDRTRTQVTNGLRCRLHEVMNGFSTLRQGIEDASDEELKNGTDTGRRSVSELKRSLSNLHRVFLDMAVIVESQGEELGDIEENVIKGREYISGGTGRLAVAERLRERRRRWWVKLWGSVLVVLIVIFICLVSRFAD